MTASTTIHCDRGLAYGAGEANQIAARPRLVLTTCILASSLAFVDGSVINVGLPAIAHSFAAGAAELQWAINAYLLPLSALLLLGGALGDRFGLRRLLVIGIGLFVSGSIGCAAALGLSSLLAARALQGVGAAMLLPSSLAILGASFRGEARGHAVGTWAAASAMAGAIGPALGGWLIDTVGWRAIFLINLPLGGAALALAFVALRKDITTSNTRAPLDVLGAALATAALGGLVWGLTLGSGPRGWTMPAIGSVVAGAAFLVAFVAVEIAKGDLAMTPPALFGSRTLIGLNLMTILLYGALGAFLVLLPYLLIEAGHYQAKSAGAALLPFPVVMASASPLMGRLAGRFGSRGLLTAGPIIVAAGFILALRLDERADYWTQLLPCILVMSIGMAGAAAPLTTAVLSSVNEQYIGLASGLNSALARAGGLVATALIGGVLAAHGALLIARFHQAMVVAAAVALLAGLCAFWALSSWQEVPDHRH
jgi:EmrB/QacA subfamily drug resistance transporter